MKRKDLEDHLQKDPNFIFLIDGLGALVSASFLGLVLATWETVFGIPKGVLHNLAVIALLFSVYSLLCHFKRPKHWKIFLRIIASANLVYCAVALAVILQHQDTISILGILYFLGEKTIVIALAIFELRVTFRKD